MGMACASLIVAKHLMFRKRHASQLDVQNNADQRVKTKYFSGYALLHHIELNLCKLHEIFKPHLSVVIRGGWIIYASVFLPTLVV